MEIDLWPKEILKQREKLAKGAFINPVDRIKEEVIGTDASAWIMVKGKRVHVPANSKLSIEFEIDKDKAELQFSRKARATKKIREINLFFSINSLSLGSK
jgi:hypothetical protein